MKKKKYENDYVSSKKMSELWRNFKPFPKILLTDQTNPQTEKQSRKYSLYIIRSIVTRMEALPSHSASKSRSLLYRHCRNKKKMQFANALDINDEHW